MLYQSNLFKYAEQPFEDHKLKWRAEGHRKVMQWGSRIPYFRSTAR